ncbi:MAG: methyltransferase domain-containing protein [Deltaproteobacteria bacterium]|nr:methyltransferase domain-containing protein [Deltaproteobacteria bacterium]
MKIAYCLETTALWGGVKVVFDQAEGLASRGHNVEIIARELAPPWRDLPCGVRAVSRVWEQEDVSSFDLVIATDRAHVPALAEKAVRLVHLVQGDDEACVQTDDDKALARQALNLPIPKIAISPELARRMARRFPGRWHWVLQAMDLSLWRPAHHLPGKRRLLLVGPFDGRFDGAIKGLPQGLLAARLACEACGLRLVRLNQFNQVREEKPFYKAKRYYHGVPPADVPAIYQSSDLFLSPSQAVEGFGLPALEALACGLPCVLSDISSYRDFDDTDDFALWAPPGDPVQMARRIEQLWRDPALQAHLRRRGPEVAALYEKNHALDRLESVLDDLVADIKDRPAVVVRSHAGPASEYYAREEKLCLEGFSDVSRPEDAPLLVSANTLLTAGELLHLAGARRSILVVGDATLIPTAHVVMGLCAALLADARVGAAGPVSNLAKGLQLTSVPYGYLNRRNYEALADRYARKGTRVEADVLQDFCLLLRADALHDLQPETKLTEIPAAFREKGWTLLVAGDVYVHRFSGMLDPPREDLQALVPPAAMSVLDIGCATGQFGKSLKVARPELYVCGIELNPQVAWEAEAVLDCVIARPVQEVSFDRTYDCVVCGELLEHLASPLALLKHLRSAIAPGGSLIASSPCVTHWSVIRDMLEGQFEYVPFGILCFEHIHFFTPASMRAVFAEAGFHIEQEISTRYADGPEAAAFFRMLQGCSFAAPKETFEIAELTVLARPV